MASASNFRVLLIVFLLTVFATATRASDYYWVNGSGNWSDYSNHWATTSGGATFHSTIPGPGDDVYFDVNSFNSAGETVTLDTTLIYCRNFTVNGTAHAATIAGTGLNCFGSFTLASTITWTVTYLTLESTSAGQTITSGGNNLSYIDINGSGEWSLLDSLECIRIAMNAGTFRANGNAIRTGSIMTQPATTIDLGAVTVTFGTIGNRSFWCNGTVLNGTQTNFIYTDGGEFRTPGTFGTVVFNGSQLGTVLQNASFGEATFNGPAELTMNNSFGKATFYSNVTFISDNQFDTLNLFCGGKNVTLYANATILVNDRINSNAACDSLITLQCYSSGSTATIQSAAATILVDWFRIRGIHTTGGATFLATNSFDLGDNSGWNFTPPATRTLYWVGGGGYWDESSHWSLTSGGNGGACPPSPVDDVIIDANSFPVPGLIRFNIAGGNCRNFDGTNATADCQITFGGGVLSIFGAISLSSSMTVYQGWVHFESSQTGNSLNTAGKDLGNLRFNGSGSWQLSDPLTCGSITMNNGTLDLNQLNVTAPFGTTLNGGTIQLTAPVYSSGSFLNYFGTIQNQQNTALIITNATGRVYGINNLASIELVNGGIIDTLVTAGKLTIKGSALVHGGTGFDTLDIEHDAVFRGPVNCDRVNFSNPGHTVQLNGAGALTISTQVSVNANCNGFITLQSETPGVSAEMNLNTVSLSGAYMIVKDITFSGTGTHLLANSIDLGNNTGATFTAPASRTLYWIGGSGNWSDAGHWSLTSGGSAAGCSPSATDTVIIDSNSSLAGDTLHVDITNASCANLNTATAGHVVIAGESFTVYGSCSLNPQMVFDTDEITFSSSGQALYDFAGSTMKTVQLNGPSSKQLQSEINCDEFLLNEGALDLNGQSIQAGRVISRSGTNLACTNATITCAQFEIHGTQSSAGNLQLILRNTPAYYIVLNNGNPITAGRVIARDEATIYTSISCDELILNGFNSTVRGASSNVTHVAGDAYFIDNCSFGTLFLNNPGKEIRLMDTLTISGNILCNSTATFPILIRNNDQTNVLPAYLNVPGVQLCLHDVFFEDITATGPGTVYAGSGCIDLGGNTGIQFAPCSIVTNVWPGDANYDLTVNNFDVLNIGLAHGFTGPVRSGANLSYIAQPATDWNNYFQSGVNHKHADTDGNGTVTAADTAAITQNYGLSHPPRLAYTSTTTTVTGPTLYVDASPDSASLNQPVTISIGLGTASEPVDSIYGIAFTFGFDPALIDTASFVFDFSSSWLGTPGFDLITFVYHHYAQGTIDFALVRNDQVNVDGYGNIANLGVVIVDNVGARMSLPLTLSGIRAITSHEHELFIQTANDSISVDTVSTGLGGVTENNPFTVYPNPAENSVMILTPYQKATSVTIFDLTGRERLQQKTDQGTRMLLDISSLSKGIYIVELTTENGVYRKQLIHQ